MVDFDSLNSLLAVGLGLSIGLGGLVGGVFALVSRSL